MDQDSAFISWLMNYLFKKLDIKIKTVAPYNPQLLQAEHGIKSLSQILTKHLVNLGQMLPKYLLLVTFAYNTFNTPNLANYLCVDLSFCCIIIRTLAFSLWQNVPVVNRQAFMLYWALHQVLANYSPCELVFGRKPKLLLNLETAPDIKVLGTFKDYYS